MNSRHRIGAAFVSALLLVGIACAAASALTSSPGRPHTVTKSTGLIVPGPNRHVGVVLPQLADSAERTAVRVSVVFSPHLLVDNATVLQLSPRIGGLAIEIAPNTGGGHNLVLSGEISPGDNLSAILAPHIRAHARFSVVLTIGPGGTVATTVDTTHPFSYTFAPTTTFLRPTTAAVGSRLDGTHGLVGTVSSFRASVQSSGPPGSDVHGTLRDLSIGFLAAALVLLGCYLGLLVLRRVREENDDAERRENARNRGLVGLVGRYWVACFGVVLVVFGALLLEYATPPDNVVLPRIGQQHLALWPVPPGTQSTYSLGSEPKLFAHASVLDVDLSFDIKAVRYPKLARKQTMTDVQVIGATSPTNDFLFYLQNNGFFAVVLPLDPIHNVWPIGLGIVPIGGWTHVEITQERNRTVNIYFDNQLVNSYTFNDPEWSITPPRLTMGVPKKTALVAFRRVRLTVREYGKPIDGAGLARIRLLQILGFLLVVAGTATLASALLSRLVPRAKRSMASLAQVVFGVAGIGLLADVAFLSRVHQNVLYYSDSTWLFSLGSRFSDFFQTLELFISRNPYGVQRGSYPPFGYLILAPLAWMTRYAALFTALAVFVGFIAWWLARGFGAARGRLFTAVVVVVGLASLPVTFALDRANTDLLVAMLLIVGAAAFERERKTISAAFFALAGAAKILPIAYLAVFLRRRQLRYVALGLALAGVVTLLSFTAFTGESLWSQIDAIRFANDLTGLTYKSPASSTPFNTSLAGWVQAIGYAIHPSTGSQSLTNIVQDCVGYVTLGGAILTAAYLALFERTNWRAITIVTCALLLLPDVNAYYSLLYVLVPLYLFVRAAPFNRRSVLIAVLFGLTLAPKTYAFFATGPYVDSSMLFTAPLLLAIAIAVIWDNLTERRSSGAEPVRIAIARSITQAPAQLRAISERASGLTGRRSRASGG